MVCVCVGGGGPPQEGGSTQGEGDPSYHLAGPAVFRLGLIVRAAFVVAGLLWSSFS